MKKRKNRMQVRSIAAIIAWAVVVLLFANKALKLDWITPVAIVLTLIAVLVYFSPRLMKQKKVNKTENSSVPDQNP
jgi:type IV secretory pathway TrbL component